MQENWSLHVPSKPKLRTYKLYKDKVLLEKYLLLPKHQRSIVAKLRSGSLPLAIETGRYNNISLEKRTCPICNNNVIEDEIHFVCVCEKLQIIRQHYFKKYCEKSSVFLDLDDKNKLIYIMSNHHYTLGKFLFELWNFRTSLLYDVNQ